MLPDIRKQKAMFKMNKILVIESDTLLLGLLKDRKEPKTRTTPFVLLTGLKSIQILHFLFNPIEFSESFFFLRVYLE